MRTQGRLTSRPRCPACGALLDGWTVFEEGGAAPCHDDVTMCLYCATALRFVVTPPSPELALAIVPPAELGRILQEQPELGRALAVAQRAADKFADKRTPP